MALAHHIGIRCDAHRAADLREEPADSYPPGGPSEHRDAPGATTRGLVAWRTSRGSPARSCWIGAFMATLRTIILDLVRRYRVRARRGRAAIFRRLVDLPSGGRVLDLGSEDGSHINAVLPRGMDVYIADIDVEPLRRGAAQYGYTPVLLSETGPLPFGDGFFDVVFCSSVIEHVTPFGKDECWRIRDGKAFRDSAQRRQAEFANEIQRVGRAFFVQTPNRWFPVESHSWAPGLAFLPRRLQVPVIAWLNMWWVKQTAPDFHLLARGDMERLFPTATIVLERSLGITKSIIAVGHARQRTSSSVAALRAAPVNHQPS